MAETNTGGVADHGWVFRGDVNYRRGDAVGVRAYDANRDILERAQAAHDHVRAMLRGRESGFRSFSLLQSIAQRFAGGNKNAVIKARMSDLLDLEAKGTIKVHSPDDIYDMLRNSGDKKLKKVAADVRQAMQRNDEFLIEGIVPGSVIHPTI